ncbi:MAG: phenylalanine--tRNA ligase subunit alpha [Candidatus Marinimicrobia bacterium]|nr:phenylalanine--tRNA ligase subunit alpha [Candidatus Neomarinimicrobiota bacterium]MBL7047151.1 phenylalanine--tRNA ligase subunit alpha [Candidatus Neomarinimicrobiota bacterium]
MSYQDKVDKIRQDFQARINSLKLTDSSLEELRVEFLGRRGKITHLISKINEVSSKDRPVFGQLINQLKQEVNDKYLELKTRISTLTGEEVPTISDPYLPGDYFPVGSIHPVEQTTQEIKRIFASIGFSIAYGPEIDDDYHNFEALNIPRHHPARDMQDTYYISDDIVLRTHTSNTQVYLMEQQKPPLRYIVPGRVYRNEAISRKSYNLFHQIEGLYVDRNVSFAELKGVLEYFVTQFFGKEEKARFRPSFFPFTEPSAEVDMSCLFCGGKGCSTCGNSGWLEILGCGMVDPAVFEMVGYDPEVWTGYAFGMGVDRLTMLKYKIEDIRLLYNGDIRFLRQF